jgi:hypothetical protein
MGIFEHYYWMTLAARDLDLAKVRESWEAGTAPISKGKVSAAFYLRLGGSCSLDNGVTNLSGTNRRLNGAGWKGKKTSGHQGRFFFLDNFYRTNQSWQRLLLRFGEVNDFLRHPAKFNSAPLTQQD